VEPNHPLCRATWVWPVDFYQMHNTYAQFRRDFRLPRVPPKAPLFITADQCYRLFVNGRYVGRGPARGYQVARPTFPGGAYLPGSAIPIVRRHGTCRPRKEARNGQEQTPRSR
jgi:hypothetical protein